MGAWHQRGGVTGTGGAGQGQAAQQQDGAKGREGRRRTSILRGDDKALLGGVEQAVIFSGKGRT